MCISQDKSELKEEEDKQSLGINDDLAEMSKYELQSSNPELSDQEPIIEEVEDKETVTDEVIESDKVSAQSVKHIAVRIVILNFRFLLTRYISLFYNYIIFI